MARAEIEFCDDHLSPEEWSVTVEGAFERGDGVEGALVALTRLEIKAGERTNPAPQSANNSALVLT